MKFIDAKLAHIDRRYLSASQEDVIRAVAWKTFDDGPCCCGNDVLADRAKATERTVRRALDNAVTLGLIRREPACRGVRGGRGRVFDTLYIVGLNDKAQTDKTPKSAEQLDDLSVWSGFRPTGQTVVTNWTACHDQPDKRSGAYIENQLPIKKQPTLSPNPSLHASATHDGETIVFDEAELKRRNGAATPSPQLRTALRESGNRGAR